jgi:hypothetical protein
VALAAMAGLAAAPASAQSQPYPGRAQAAPVDAESAFEPALECMDELLSRSNSVGAGHILVPMPIADPAQKGGFTRDMIIGAATKMSQRSHFFKLILDPASVPKQNGYFQTGGSVTAFEQQIESKDTGGGVSIASAIGGTVTSRNGISNLTVSLYLTGANQQLIDGTYHSRTLRLETKGKSRFLSGFLSFLGGSLSMTTSRADGPQAGVKALIDLAMIEAVGSLAQVPYATCLARVVNAETTSGRWESFRRMKAAQQRAAVVAEMVRRGLAPENPDAVQLKQAITAFERSQGLAPSGLVRFELYEALMRLEAAPAPMNRPAMGKPAVKVSGVPGPFRYGGALPTVSKGDKLGFQVTVAEHAYVACYYTDAAGKVTRVFPNPFRPSYRLSPGEILRMPAEQDPYVIRPEKKGTGEWFTCFASRDDFLQRIAGAVPDSAFDPLDRFRSAAQLVDAAMKADPSLSTDTLTFRVE